MKIAGTLVLILGFSGVAYGDLTIVGDAWVSGKLGVGTTAPGARAEIRAGSSAGAVFQISGVDETPFILVNSAGEVGMGTAPAANLDISDVGDIGLQLRNGNLYPATSDIQIAFGENGTANHRHGVRSVHLSSTARNSIDFLVWEPDAGGASSMADIEVVSLVTHSTGAAVHIRPVAGDPQEEVVVSNGMTFGGGTVHRASEASPSSRDFKSDIEYLGPEEELRAFRELANLKHASFRYKVHKKGRLVKSRKSPKRRGVLYEEAPASIKRPGNTISIDARVTNAEMALKVFIRTLETVEAGAAGRELP